MSVRINIRLMKFEKDGYTRIGVMPRYGDARSVKWFEVQPNCTFHLINCFEEGNQVITLCCIPVQYYWKILKNVIFGQLVLKYATLKKNLEFMSPFNKEFNQIALFFFL